MQTKKLLLILFSFAVLLLPQVVRATVEEVDAAPVKSPDVYYRAQVLELHETTTVFDGILHPVQKVRMRITTGEEAGKEIAIDHGADFTLQDQQRVHEGETIVVARTETVNPEDRKTAFFYYIVEPYRIPSLVWFFAGFFVLIAIFSRLKGIFAILGLAFSILVLVKGVVVWIVHGTDPLLACLFGAVIIAFFSLYLAHGFAKRTTLALVSTLITLGIATGIAFLFVYTGKLFGFGSEEAFFLQSGVLANIDLRGLLLGGIIIGALGVLDDITTGQTAAVEEIHKANTSLGFGELYHRGLSVGREHIASLVNTLALAYIGASFPLLLLFVTNTTQPWWMILNSESIAEEIVRTLVGSSALVFAVPIATLLAAYTFSKKK